MSLPLGSQGEVRFGDVPSTTKVVMKPSLRESWRVRGAFLRVYKPEIFRSDGWRSQFGV